MDSQATHCTARFNNENRICGFSICSAAKDGHADVVELILRRTESSDLNEALSHQSKGMKQK